MQLHTQEHAEIIDAFERLFPGCHDKEDKARMSKGNVYQNGEMNKLFDAFRHGYSVARSVYITTA